MKKKTISKLIMLAVVSTLLTACSNTNATVTETPSATASNEQLTENEEKPAETTVEVAASSDQASEEDFVTVELEDGTVQITDYKGEATEIIVPDTINGKEVSSIGGFGGKTSITTVILPNTVKEICDSAFANCDSLQTVQLSTNLETIGKNAFQNDVNLTQIDLTENIVSIGLSAFDYTGITNITIPAKMEKIEGSFSLCKLTELNIPGTIKSIEQASFSNCEDLTKVTIQDGVEAIGDEAFYGCASLETVTIPATVTEIEKRTFNKCDNLTIITSSGSYAETYANEQGIPCEIQ